MKNSIVLSEKIAMAKNKESSEFLTIGEHLEIFRKMLFRILVVFLIITIVIFCLKKELFEILLAPKSNNFITLKIITDFIRIFNPNFSFVPYNIPLISTELSSQFMSHIYVSCIFGILLSSPYILFELLKYVTPALYENEKKYSLRIALIVFVLFIIGVLMSYFILFPISFRFLATYQVDESVTSTITLDSYISTFSSLIFLCGIIFQLPLICYFLGKMGIVSPQLFIKWRPYALVFIMVIAAIITPPDIFTLILVTIPIYTLYEISIIILKRCTNKE